MEIQNRIAELLKEQETLVKQYNGLSQQLQTIMTRVIQIQGALDELQKLVQETPEVQKSQESQSGQV